MENEPKCLYCGKDDRELPLINLTFQGKPLWLCGEHLPLLIHQPAKLAERLNAIKSED